VDKAAPVHYDLQHPESQIDYNSPSRFVDSLFDPLQDLSHYSAMGSMQQESHFKKLQNFKADYADASFTQYESQRTGLRVVVVDRKGPKVYGNFAVATEIHDDSGSRKSRRTFR
jgi:hypothetical protein